MTATVAHPGRITVEFRTDDPVLARVLGMLNEMGAYTAARAECEAHLYMALARCAWRDADRIRAGQRDRDHRSAAAQRRGKA